MSGRLEGNGAARFIQLMKRHGHNADMTLDYGTVTSAPPAIKVRLDGDTFDLDADDLVVAGSVADKLTAGKRVAVLVTNNGQQYFLIDEAVTY